MECPVCYVPNADHARFCAKCGALLPATAPDETDPLIGQIIKKTFRVVRLLGEGGMGRVYEGEQQMGSKARKVAIKTLHPHLSQDPGIVARFNRECGTVAELEHPNTIQFFDFGATDDGTLFIAMEFLDGDSVGKILETTGPMPSARVENILRQVSGSLFEAHQKGIVHRDLKPDNIVLIRRAGEEDSVKVLDFGIAARRESTDAKAEAKLTQQGMVLGTPPYMSPEQFTGKELDFRSDIYSLGVMAYEMLTGKLPFEAGTPWEWATKHLTERPFPFEITSQTSHLIPDRMKAAIMRAMSKNRDDRQANVNVFYQELSGGSVPAIHAVATAGTAAMAAVPAAFESGGHSGTVAGNLAMPAPMPQPQYGPPPQVMHQPQAAYAPPARSSGGSKAPLIALAALVGVGLLVGLVFVIKAATKKGGDDDPGILTGLNSAAGGAATIAPLPPDSTTPPVADVTDAGKAPIAKATGAAPAASTAAAKGPQGEEACQESAKTARQGNIEAAVSLYRLCQNGGRSAPMAKAAIEQNAGPAAKRKKFNGDCAGAKRIAAAAQSIGAGGGAPAEAASCK